MCGICGVVGLDAPLISVAEVLPMCAELRRRGPDAEGVWTDGTAALGHRRLSVIDVEGGLQPLGNEDGTVQVVFNGEIYDFAALRERLRGLGHVFRTRSDAEVLVHGWESWGPALVEHVHGMFAFALWDGRQRTLFLARDRFGKKPLYWYRGRRRFIFASTLTALLQHPDVPRVIDETALQQYLAFGMVPAPRSILNDVHKLSAGSTLLLKSDGQISIDRFFQLRIGSSAPAPSFEAAEEELRSRLIAATRRRLVSDVPLGFFLSGGIDSSSVVAAAAHAGARRMQTFSVGFEEQSFDETRYARAVARRYDTDHHELRLSSDELLSIVPELGNILDEPLADSSIVPTYALSRFARSNVTVVLSGDGGDELFAGYPTYSAHQWTTVAKTLTGPAFQPLAKVLGSLAERMPVSHRYLSIDFRLKRLCVGLLSPDEIRQYVWLGVFRPEELSGLLGSPADDGAVWEPITHAWNDAHASTPLEKVLAQDVAFYLGQGVLPKVDRASMACGLEVRSPLLDTEFATWAAGLPVNFKLRGGRGKWILRRAVSRWLPAPVIRRKKQGFAMPIGLWLKGPLRARLRSLLLDQDGLCASGLLHRPSVERLLDDHDHDVTDHRQRLWSLFVLESWRRAHMPIANPLPQRVRDPSPLNQATNSRMPSRISTRGA